MIASRSHLFYSADLILKLKCGLGFVLLLMVSPACAQEDWLWQWEPEFSYTHRLGGLWKVNAKASFLQSLTTPAEAETDRQYQFDQAQVQFFATYSLRTNLKVSGGYYFRINDPTETLGSHNHRLAEQFAFVSQVGGRRWANRLRLEQRFQDQGYVNRARYRVSFDVPLNGERIDPGEKYLIVSDEWLFSFTSRQSESQNRLYLGIGWFANPERKTEVGVQYRLGGIGSEDLSNTLWFTTAFYWNQP